METPIRDVIAKKGSTVHTIGRDATVFEAITLMEEVRVGSLVVTEGEGEVVGMLTERDYLRKVAIQGRASRTTAVHEIMASPVVCVDLDDSVSHALSVMTEKRCRHLPVVGPDGLAGLVSIGDLVKQIVRVQKSEIRFLHDYIEGKYPG